MKFIANFKISVPGSQESPLEGTVRDKVLGLDEPYLKALLVNLWLKSHSISLYWGAPYQSLFYHTYLCFKFGSNWTEISTSTHIQMTYINTHIHLENLCGSQKKVLNRDARFLRFVREVNEKFPFVFYSYTTGVTQKKKSTFFAYTN